MKRAGGFTLVELMVAVALLGIVVSLAAPSFATLVERHRNASQINNFLADVTAARSEATRTRRTVIMCPRASAATCDGSGMASGGCQCSASGHWEDGWLTFVDLNGDGVLDANDQLVSDQGALDGPNTLRRSGAGNFPNLAGQSIPNHARIAFRGRGTLIGPAATMALCETGDDDAGGLEAARFLALAASGRAGVRGALASETSMASVCRFGRGV